MARFVVFRKIRETETEVEYRFGSKETELNRAVVINKQAMTFVPTEGKDDSTVDAVVGKVSRRHSEIKTWPGGGTIQS